MTETQAILAANVLKDNGCFEAAEKMESLAETCRKQHFQEMQARCFDDQQFADSYEQDRRDGF